MFLEQFKGFSDFGSKAASGQTYQLSFWEKSQQMLILIFVS